ncbi:hypothetical protein P171DRAFT_475679 [Karstenula rhodostoma CBS 690.94]|uniref:Uncharacterized protein n=1 Tax=Karstenula rhodostoma CBS 690.94 TaxID=1392251 RepID=A0A9P4PA88_9PLEO|nr:hypothetical protein P171DRAFT_475679 [Karstenula rhodostoma CBS 690.94]
MFEVAPNAIHPFKPWMPGSPSNSRTRTNTPSVLTSPGRPQNRTRSTSVRSAKFSTTVGRRPQMKRYVEDMNFVAVKSIATAYTGYRTSPSVGDARLKVLPASEWSDIDLWRDKYLLEPWITAYFEHKVNQQIWVIDFEYWAGKKDVAALGLQGSIMNLFDQSKQYTFNINYGMSLEGMKRTFALAVPEETGTLAKFRNGISDRVYGDISPLDCPTLSKVKEEIEKIGFEYDKALVLYWSNTKADLQCLARIFYKTPQMIMTPDELLPTFDIFLVMSFFRRTYNMPIY